MAESYQQKLDAVVEVLEDAGTGPTTNTVIAENILQALGIPRPAVPAGCKKFRFVGEIASYDVVRVVEGTYYEAGCRIDIEEGKDTEVTHISGNEYLLDDGEDKAVIAITEDELREDWRPARK